MSPAPLSAKPSHQVMVRMTPEMHAAVKALAASNDRTMAQEVRRAVRLALAAPAHPYGGEEDE